MASGSSLPYDGYFECTITIPVTDTFSLSETIPVLIVHDTAYNTRIPLLLGTNILKKLLDCSQKPSSYQLQVAMQALQLQVKHLDKTCGIYSNVVSACDINVPPHSGCLVEGKTVVAIPICQQIALVQDFDGKIETVPSIVNIKQGQNSVPIDVRNDSDETLHISRGQQIATLHQAAIQPLDETGESEILDAFDYSHLDEDDKAELQSFLEKHRDVFALDITELGCTDVIEHRIDLEDETPFRDKPRPVPPGMLKELRSHLMELLSAGIIRESQSPFS